jgi:hypothetical protein
VVVSGTIGDGFGEGVVVGWGMVGEGVGEGFGEGFGGLNRLNEN